MSSKELCPFVRAPLCFTSTERLPGYLHSVPELLDFNAANNPDHAFCIQACANSPFDTVTYAQLDVAVDGCACWFEANVPALSSVSTGNVASPIALLMESDVGILLHQFALWKLGVPVLLLSTRLPPQAILHLLGSLAVSTLVVSDRLHKSTPHGLWDDLQEMRISMQVGLPYRKYLHPHNEGIPYQTPANVRKNISSHNLLDNVLYLHSSGTTGLPKPIPLTHRHLVFNLSCHNFETEAEAQGRNASTLPLFHGYGLIAPMLSMSVGKTTCLPATDEPPNPASIIHLIETTEASSLMTVPFLLDEIATQSSTKAIEVLARLDFVGTGGAALGPGVGSKLTKAGVKILNFYGTTETGHLSQIFVPKLSSYEWRFFHLRPDIKVHITPVVDHLTEERLRLTIFPFGDDEGIEIEDHLIRNKLNPQTEFAVLGRSDDLIVLATGEKVDPSHLESTLGNSSLIKAAVVFGVDRFEIGVILQPSHKLHSTSEYDQFKDSVWPLILQAGEKMDAFAKISSPDALIIVSENTVIPRADKGSILRRDVYNMFQTEIDNAYKNLERGAMNTDTVTDLDIQNLEQSIKSLIQEELSLPHKPEDWTTEDNFFDLGLDSLQIRWLQRAMLVATRNAPSLYKRITSDFVYANPSVRQMASSLARTYESTKQQTPWEEVERLAQEYSPRLHLRSLVNSAGSVSQREGIVVLLTGSSGSLGLHCLAGLTRSQQVSQIICLVRTGKGGSSSHEGHRDQRALLKSKGIEISEQESSKIEFIYCNPTLNFLGLSEKEHVLLARRITHVVHAAWPMDFHRRLSSFRYQFQFLRNLLVLSMRSGLPQKFIFISSIAAVAKLGLESPNNAIKEAPVQPVDATIGIGYSDAKIVCEKILEEAAGFENNSVEISIVRCGQISGSSKTGVWNIHEQIPMMLRSAQVIDKLPQLDGTLSWIPVDIAAGVLRDLLLSPRPLKPVYHLENPVRQRWSDTIDIIGKQLALNVRVPFEDWLEEVVAVPETDGDTESVPVKKLYSFFKQIFRAVSCGQVLLETKATQADSRLLHNLHAVEEDVIVRYVKYWQSVEYL